MIFSHKYEFFQNNLSGKLASKIVDIGKNAGIEIIDGKDLLESLNIANRIGQQNPIRILICGSLHLARDVRKFSSFLIN